VDRNKEDGKEDWVGKEKGLKGRKRGLGKNEKTEINLREGGGEKGKRGKRELAGNMLTNHEIRFAQQNCFLSKYKLL
jgi:hypothetical protein